MIDEPRLPASQIAEESVLACILLDPTAITQVMDSLTPEHFHHEHTRVVYEVMLTLFNERQTIDYLALCAELDQRNRLRLVNDHMNLIDLEGRVVSSSQIERQASLVIADWRFRQGTVVGTQLVQDSYDRNPEALTRAETALFTLSQGKSVQETVVSHRDEVGVYLARVFELQATGVLPGIPTGLRSLDKKIGGLHKGHLIVIGGRPGDGKTAAALTIADHAVHAGCTVLFYSLEMGKEELMQRWIAMTARIDSTHLRDNALSDIPDREGQTELDRVVAAEKTLRTLDGHLLIDDTSGNTDRAMRSRAVRVQAEYGLDLIIVDYLQLARAADTTGRPDRRQMVEEVSRNLKNMARDLQVPVLALAQLNRDSVNQKRPPTLSDFRETGQIEQDADEALLLYRPTVDRDGEELDPNATEYNLELRIEKNRHGPRGIVDLRYIGAYTQMCSVSEQREVSV